MANPRNPSNVIAGQNDSTLGFNHCGYDYSLDGGLHWGSGTPPFFGRLNHPPRGHTIRSGSGTSHSYDVAADPSVAFDGLGNAFFSCILSDVHDNASGIYVARSPATAQGSFYEQVPAAPSNAKDPGSYVVVEDNSARAMADQEKIAADQGPKSRFRNHVYVAWTEFISGPKCRQGGECYSSIYFSRSSNHAQTWSKPQEISGSSSRLCFGGNLFDKARKPHACDFDQSAQPVVLPSGKVVVLFTNANRRGSSSNNQILSVASTDGGKTWSHPDLAGHDITHRDPQCEIPNQQGAEECIPGAFIRVEDGPRVAVDPKTGTLCAVWNDYSPGRYAIRIAESTNGGVSWKELPKPVDFGKDEDAYMPSIGVSGIDHTLAIGFYGTGRIPKEDQHAGVFRTAQPGVAKEPTTFYLATSLTPAGPFVIQPMSPAFASPNGAQAGFNGDYTGMAVVGGVAHPIWSDTRNVFRTFGVSLNDEDVFTKSVTLP